MPLENLTFYLPEPNRFINESYDGGLLLYFNGNHPDFSIHPELKKKTVAAVAVKLETGVYETGFNFDHTIDGFTKETQVKDYKHYFDEDGNCMPIAALTRENPYYAGFYGVADDVDQIKEYYKKVIEKNRVVISVTEVKKSEEPASGGWRWHKWGQYIGTENPQCEYLYDEPEINRVYCFHIHVLVDKADK